MRFAYADPPYIGQAKKHYAKEAEADGRVASEVDHVALIESLEQSYPGEMHAWALSCSTPSLEEILHICRRVVGPNYVRVCSWVKPFASFKPGVNPGYAWEPIIVRGGRKLGREVPTVRDWVSANITLRKGVSGAKPVDFCFWLFEFVGLEPDDEFTDLFPGSGAVTLAWEAWKNQSRLIA